MEVIVDLKGIKGEEEVLLKFGEILDFPAWWGVNYSAFNDCLAMMDTDNSKVMKSPLKVEVKNYDEFKDKFPERFQWIKEDLEKWADKYKKEGKVFEVVFA